MTNSPYQDLKIWQKGMDLVEMIYDSTSLFPKEELFGLQSQMRRASVSIPSNIAEGSQRKSDKDFANFVVISKGSLSELETQLIIAYRRKYIAKENYTAIVTKIDELQRMLFSFYQKLTSNELIAKSCQLTY